MSSAGETDNPPLRHSIFLSYASEDRAAASSIRDTLEAAGLEVWFDEEELGGGDAWDRKIRRQIRECDYFMPVISARTEARPEGYFRREWRLAVERTLDMADDHTFLLPVAIDGTDQATARVPDRFLTVQWLKAPNGQPTPALTALCTRLTSGTSVGKPTPRRAPPRTGEPRPAPTPREIPEFPTEEPGQRLKFFVHVVGWILKSAWVVLQRLPRWLRLIIYVWLASVVLSRSCSRNPPESTGNVSPEAAQKIKALAEKYRGNPNAGDIAKLGLDLANDVSRDIAENTKGTRLLLAIPFMAQGGNPTEAKLADSIFALLFGRISISRHGQVDLSKEPLPSLDIGGAVNRGRGSHSSYVLYGGIESLGAERALTAEIVDVANSSTVWSKSYPVANADPAAIATEIEAKIPSLDDN
jgi:hypothetical protein